MTNPLEMENNNAGSSAMKFCFRVKLNSDSQEFCLESPWPFAETSWAGFLAFMVSRFSPEIDEGREDLISGETKHLGLLGVLGIIHRISLLKLIILVVSKQG